MVVVGASSDELLHIELCYYNKKLRRNCLLRRINPTIIFMFISPESYIYDQIIQVDLEKVKYAHHSLL